MRNPHMRLCSIETGIRMAIVAEVEEWGKTIIVGLAEYDKVDSEIAEVGIVVGDHYQGLGLGTQMIKKLVKHAKRDGINKFSASVHPNNIRVLTFIRKSPLPVIKR